MLWYEWCVSMMVRFCKGKHPCTCATMRVCTVHRPFPLLHKQASGLNTMRRLRMFGYYGLFCAGNHPHCRIHAQLFGCARFGEISSSRHEQSRLSEHNYKKIMVIFCEWKPYFNPSTLTYEAAVHAPEASSSPTQRARIFRTLLGPKVCFVAVKKRVWPLHKKTILGHVWFPGCLFITSVDN